MLNNQLLKAPRQAMVAIGVAAVLLGVLGFSISVAASLRSRRTQSAVFAALGVGKNAQAGQLCLEQFALSVPAAAAGRLAGIWPGSVGRGRDHPDRGRGGAGACRPWW